MSGREEHENENRQFDVVPVIGGVLGILLALMIHARAYRREGLRGNLKTVALANGIVIPAYVAFRWWSR